MMDGTLTKAADVWSFGVICWELYRYVLELPCWRGVLGRPTTTAAHAGTACTAQPHSQRWLPHARSLANSPPALPLPPCPFRPLCSGVRAYVGHRMPHIVYLVTSGKGALKLPEGAPKGFDVRAVSCRRRLVLAGA